MIDAYEVGIQLLLQDDVSAGLAVINQGLADVDRAIAATSAGLASLVQEANRASAAIAASLGGKPAQPANQARSIEPGSAEASADRQTARPERSIEAAKPEPPAAMPAEPRSVANPQPAPAATAPAKPNTAGGTEPEVRGSAPPTATQAFQAQAGAAEPASGGRAEPSVPQAPIARAQTPSLPLPAKAAAQIAPASPVQRPAPRPSARVAVTASIQQSGFAADADARPAPERHRDQVQTAPARETAKAPWAGVEHRRGVSNTVRNDDRATAPPAQFRERTDGGGGTVMLDGRLVGQWLAEHMAQEASRPPSGTSFFDPRQTPAWNPSGAL